MDTICYSRWRDTFSIYVTVFLQMLWMLVMKWYNIKKEIISPHTNYTDRIISKCNPDFILPISTPTLDVGAATPRRLVSTVGCIQSKKCFDDRRIGRGKNMHMWTMKTHLLVQTTFFSLFFFLHHLLRILHQLFEFTQSHNFQNTFIFS